jgi:hypothetical protein
LINISYLTWKKNTDHQLRGTSRVTSTSDRPRLSYQRIESIDDRTNWQSALQNIDVVIHLATRAHILK